MGRGPDEPVFAGRRRSMIESTPEEAPGTAGGSRRGAEA